MVFDKKKYMKEYGKEYRKKNKIKISKRAKEYAQKSEVKSRLKEYQKKYNQRPENKDSIKEYKKLYYKKYSQRPEVRIIINKRIRKRKKSDIQFTTILRLRSRLSNALLKFSKTGKIMSSKKYGINYKEIFKHLKPFPKSIENYEIDHIIPLSWFNFNNHKEIEWAFAPENHQWLTKEENLKKGNKYIMVAERTINND